MIKFKTVKWKNFLSTGNAFTEIQLNQKPTTLVVGENGSGKSTMLDAICFALFGKPYRNINKPQLVNSINNKECVVELEFSIGKNHYKIVRGIKPAVFEIWVNGVMINQDAASRDYQAQLEDGILKLNYKSFTQIVILGSTSFTPFMQLPAASRREVIEDILDIKIFTAMNLVLKDKSAELKSNIQEAETKITIAKNKAETQDAYIKTLQEDRENKIATLDVQIQDTLKEIEERTIEYDLAIAQRHALSDAITDLTDVSSSLDKMQRYIQNCEDASEKIETEIAFYHNNDNCPKCKQIINPEFKETIITDNQKELQTLENTLQNIRNNETEMKNRLVTIRKTMEYIEETNQQINKLENENRASERFIQRLEIEKNDVQQKIGNIEQEKQKLKDMAKGTLKIIKERAEYNETSSYYEVASTLLKDSGIKTRVIKKYLPVINKLVNKYLRAMDFFVQFTLDEKFNEVIKSRNRDEFSYESFSEGEKQRIDLALLFTWRKIAKLKNSSSTNLLILDEVFDSSLDASATEYVMELLNTIGDNTHVFVISHKGDQLFDKFTNIIKFSKKKNFSVIV
jgi:DNA repair exonuclease SbcCD ATPase subunit